MPGGQFTVRQFILPIQINGTPLWGWLDTGANVSIIPKEVATSELGMSITDRADGGYDLANLVRVPYQSHTFDVGFFDHIDGTIRRLDDEPYQRGAGINFRIFDVEFQIPTLTWPEIAAKIVPQKPTMVVDNPIPWVILGSDGVIEKLHLSIVGDNAVTVSPLDRP